MAETATPVQEQVLNTIQAAQEATVKVARGWAKTLTTATPAMGDIFSPPKVDTYLGFAEKVWASQRDFMVSMLEVATEVGKTLPETVRKAATAAAPVAK